MGEREIILVDIDGTISKVGDRLKYLKETPKNWDAFYDACFEDEPIMDVIKMLWVLKNSYDFVFCTGRRESVRIPTEEWLKRYDLEGILLMRKNGDFRHDTDAKPELLKENEINIKNIAFVLEDRNSMVKKWRKLGLTCYQVADGDF